MQIFMGKKKMIKSNKSKSINAKSKSTCQQQNSGNKNRCRALCCGSSTRLSVSSATSCSELLVGSSSEDAELMSGLSNMAHGMVQARLEHIIDENSREIGTSQRRKRDGFIGKTFNKSWSSICTTGEVKKYVVLVAMERDSYDPREDFQSSIMEVITCKGLIEPRELKGLLNCYISMNSRKHRQAILEAFVDVCSALFVCKREDYAYW